MIASITDEDRLRRIYSLLDEAQDLLKEFQKDSCTFALYRARAKYKLVILYIETIHKKKKEVIE